MFNILHLSESWGIGGAENVLINIVTNLDKTKFTFSVGLAKDGPLKDALIKNNIEVLLLNNKPFKDFSFLLNLLYTVRKKSISLNIY